MSSDEAAGDQASGYDRTAAARVLAGLAAGGLFPENITVEGERQVEYTATPLRLENDSTLTLSQRLYLEQFMAPCPAEHITSATHRMTWTDSSGVPNVSYFHADGLGPLVPIATREAVLVLWRELRENTQFAADIAQLDSDALQVLRQTTTDGHPSEIFRVGIEAAGRVVAQHALVSWQTSYRDATDFVRTLWESGIFRSVATQWFWELQASTYRRGMIPVVLEQRGSGSVRYSPQTVAIMRAMKDKTIADARSVMHRATTEEGLDPAAAVAKYHDELDLISRQYALLPADTHPVCLAATAQRLEGHQSAVLALVAERLVRVFEHVISRCLIVPLPQTPVSEEAFDEVDRVFHVPDMSCRHCVKTIGAVLEARGVTVHEIDLDRKRVVAEFRSPLSRFRAFEALRDSGYNPVAPDETTGR